MAKPSLRKQTQRSKLTEACHILNKNEALETANNRAYITQLHKINPRFWLVLTKDMLYLILRFAKSFNYILLYNTIKENFSSEIVIKEDFALLNLNCFIGEKNDEI